MYPAEPAAVRFPWAPTIACALLLTVCAAGFLRHQDLWLDEVAQLRGIALGPVEVTRRLLGFDPSPDFGDRSPPLSFWVASAWATLFGVGETAQRWLSVLLVALAVPAVTGAAQRIGGVRAAWLAGLLFALSPNAIGYAVEIRSYALFLLVGGWAVYFCVRLLESPERAELRWLAALALVLASGVYVHVFVVVQAAALLAAALAVVVLHRGPSLRIVGAGVAVCVASAGVAMFLEASPPGDVPAVVGSRFRELARLLYRLVGHPALALYPVLQPVVLLAGAVGAAIALGAGWRRSPPVVGAGLALALGFAAAAGGTFLVSGPNRPANPRYSVWMLPMFFVLLSAGPTLATGAARHVATVSLAVLILASGYSAVSLAAHGAYFAHTPHDRVAALVRRVDPREVSVVHDSGSDGHWHLHAALAYTYGPTLTQYAATDDESANVVRFGEQGAPVAAVALPSRYLLVVRSRWQSEADIGEQLRGGDRPLGDGAVARALASAPAWRRIESALFVAQISADVDLFEARGAEDPEVGVSGP